MDDVVFYNVNEDGLPYNRSDYLNAAMDVLRAFPNDTIVICIRSGATDLRLWKEM